MYERFVQLLQEKGITAYRVYKDTGIPQATLSDWKRGISTPKYENLLKISNYFGVSVEWLRGETDEKNKPTADSDRLNEDGVKVALFDGDKEVPDEAWDDVKDYIKFIKGKYNL